MSFQHGSRRFLGENPHPGAAVYYSLTKKAETISKADAERYYLGTVAYAYFYLFDPAVGSAGPSQRVDAETFSLLCEQGWVTTEDIGVVRRYIISETGVARLLARPEKRNPDATRHAHSHESFRIDCRPDERGCGRGRFDPYCFNGATRRHYGCADAGPGWHS